MQRYILLLTFFLLLIAATITGLFYFLRVKPGAIAAEVSITLTAPEETTSGDETAFFVRYKNGTRVPLTDTELFFRYPEGAVPLEKPGQRIEAVSLGTLAPGAEGAREFRAQLIGTKGSIVVSSAELSYKSAGATTFRKRIEAATRIADIAFFLDFVVPQRALAGERIVYFLTYENMATRAFPETVIRVRYPTGFSFSSAEPAPTAEQTVWEIGEIPTGGRGRITITGTLSGTEGETKKVLAEIGFLRQGLFFPYAESSFDTIIAPSPLSVSAELIDRAENVARRGETLNVRIRYKNSAEIPLQEVVLRAALEGDMFSLRKVTADSGFFDSTRNVALWTPANVKELSFVNPGEEHAVILRATLKEAFPIASAGDANFTARIVVTAETINVPPSFALNKLSSSATLEVKIETAPEFTAAAYYRDETSGIVNTGPLPPKANVETRFTIHWRIAVPANDLENVEVRTTLPTGIVPTGTAISYYTDAKPSFNATAGEVAWFIPRVPANTGVTSPAYETVFQVAVIPSVTQIDQAVELARISTLSAVDAFTGRQLSARTPALSTERLSDAAPDGKRTMWRVVP